MNNLTLHLQEPEDLQQRQPRASTRRDITKIRAELNDIETKSRILRINESRSWVFEMINKIRNERGEITIDTTEMQRIVRHYYKDPICQEM